MTTQTDFKVNKEYGNVGNWEDASLQSQVQQGQKLIESWKSTYKIERESLFTYNKSKKIDWKVGLRM